MKDGLRLLQKELVHVVITDVKLPDGNGVEMTKKIKAAFPAVEVIVLTAFGTIQDGVQAIKNGAFDYLTKGDHQEKIIPLLSRAMEKSVLQHKVSALESSLQKKYGFSSIIGKSPKITRCIELARKVAGTTTTVLLLGETGTGKEVFARAIHYEGERRSKPFVALNCGAFPKDLLESELFGHAEGAFTGATKSKRGLIEEASDGTLFLDEIGEMNLELQSKLLRLIETGEFYRIGDTKLRKVDIRLMAATHRQLDAMVARGEFREDLFYRLSVFSLSLPPLRERREDMEALTRYFVQDLHLKLKKQVTGIQPEFFHALSEHSWKGNIRELRNVVERCIILSENGELSPSLLPSDFNLSSEVDSPDLATMEKNHIRRVLEMAGGNKTKAAKLLGIGLTTLYQKIKDFRL